jgi:hypothetical protein
VVRAHPTVPTNQSLKASATVACQFGITPGEHLDFCRFGTWKRDLCFVTKFGVSAWEGYGELPL